MALEFTTEETEALLDSLRYSKLALEGSGDAPYDQRRTSLDMIEALMAKLRGN